MDGVDRERLIVPGLAGLYAPFAPWSYAFMRFAAGAVLAPHGYPKLFSGAAAGTAAGPLTALGLAHPLAWAYLVGAVELFGGIMLALGLLTRIAALAIAIEMTVIILFVLWPYGYDWTRHGYEYALLWDLLAIAIFFKGGGRYSVDRLVGKEF